MSPLMNYGSSIMTTSSVVMRHGGITNMLLQFAPFAILCDRYVSLLWFVIGIPGNIISFIVWMTPRIRRENSSAIYLAALSLNDVCLLMLVIVNDMKYAWNYDLIGIPVICELFNVLFLTLQYLSPLMVLTFTVERFIAVCYPFYRDKLCTPKRAACVVAFMLLLSLSLCIVQGYFWSYKDGLCSLDTVISATPFYTYYIFAVEMLISAGVPIFTLIFNIIVIRELHRITYNSSAAVLSGPDSIQERPAVENNSDCSNRDGYPQQGSYTSASMHRPHSRAPSSRGSSILQIKKPTNTATRRSDMSRNYRSTTVMLLTVSFYLICTTLPVGLVYALQSLSEVPESLHTLSDEQVRVDPSWERFFIMRNAKSALDELALSHFACNFIIYIVTGRVFRQQLFSYFRCRSQRRRAPTDSSHFAAHHSHESMHRKCNLPVDAAMDTQPQKHDVKNNSDGYVYPPLLPKKRRALPGQPQPTSRWKFFSSRGFWNANSQSNSSNFISTSSTSSSRRNRRRQHMPYSHQNSPPKSFAETVPLDNVPCNGELKPTLPAQMTYI